MLVLVAVSAAAAEPGSDAASLRERTHSAVLDLYALDSRLHSAQGELASLQTEAANLRKEQATLAQQLAATRRTLTASQQRLGENLRTLYEQGDTDPLAVMLGAESLDDAITKLDNLTRVANQSHEVVKATADAKRRLDGLRATLADRRARLDASVVSAARTAADLAAAHDQRVAFIAGLRLKARQLAALQATAAHAEAKSQAMQAAANMSPTSTAATTDTGTDTGTGTDTTPAAPTPTTAPPQAQPAPPAARSGKSLTVSTTGYALPGRTATGIPVGWGVVAVDPSVIPLGTRMTIPGYGEGVAADTGGAVRGAMIDLWFPSQAQAGAWGRRTVTITLH